MTKLEYSHGRKRLTIDQTGFEYNNNHINWRDITSVKETRPTLSGGGEGERTLHINTQGKCISIRADQIPDNALLALRVVLKELLTDKVTLEGPRYLKFGPEECEFTLSMARFLRALNLLEESKFAYEHAVQIIEYYHNHKHILLCEPLESLNSLLKQSDPKAAQEFLSRAQEIRRAPHKDLSFFQALSNSFKPDRKKKLKEAIEEFRRTKGREPKNTEKARILAEIEAEDD